MRAKNYYNEFEPYAAEWLRNLISAGHIAPGDVDERSIEDVTPDDLRGYTQCHFFAGIGVWSYALRCAGWPDDRPVWTGSCPCQPFSAAGKRGGTADERHLWPHFHYLIEQCDPYVVLGEQVASKDGLGWFDLVQADLEGTGYASGAVDLCAAGIGAPHIRQRLWWVAERMADTSMRGQSGGLRGSTERPERPLGRHGSTGRLGDDDDDARLEGHRNRHPAESGHGQGTPRPVAETGQSGGVADAHGGYAGAERQQRGGEQRQQQANGGAGGLAEPDCAGCQSGQRDDPAARHGHSTAAAGGNDRHESTGPTNGFWRDADWLFCRDGKWRPVEPGTFPLAHGAPARVGRLRAYGNAIVAQAAQTFIEAYLESRNA